MKLLFVTTKRDRSRQRIVDEAERAGMAVTKVYYEDISPEQIIGPEGHDFAIIRDPYNSGEDYSGHMKRIVNSFGNKALDHRIFSENPDYEDKLFQHKLFGGIMEMPRYWHFKTREEVRVERFPVVAKKRISSRGKGVFVLETQSDLERFLDGREIDDYIFEEMVGVEKDIRILVLDGRIIGALERKVRRKDNLGFTGIGVKGVGKFPVPPDLEEKAIEIAKRSKADFVGIDIAIDSEGNSRLLECNISPQFVALERELGENVAGKLIEFAVRSSRGASP